MNDSFGSLIESATSILVLLPARPDLDQAAAGLSLYLALKGTKDVSISSPNPMTVGFNRLIGIDRISADLGNRNLEIRFKGYDANNIEKVSYDIENGEFKLTVVPKNGFIAPNKDQFSLNYVGVSSDLVILIGGTGDADFPAISTKELATAKIAHIGTRALSSSVDILSFAQAGASVSEVVANIIKNAGLAIDPDIATNLVMGVEEGSLNFTSVEITPDTFETFAYLLRSGGVRQPKIKVNPIAFPPGSIPTQPFSMPVAQVAPVVPQAVPAAQPQNTQVQDIEGTQEHEQDVNPPDDWLKTPKVYKGTSVS